MIDQVISVSNETVVDETAKMKFEGYRFVTMSCFMLDETTVQLLYHFDKNLELRHLRFSVTLETLIPSISRVYSSAFLVENEIQDLFGVHFQGITVDYERTLYLDEEVKAPPFCGFTARKSAKGQHFNGKPSEG